MQPHATGPSAGGQHAGHQGSPNGEQTGVLVLCPYCGCTSDKTRACSHCGGHFDLLSRQRTQNGMGPWYIRHQVKPFHPGCSYATLRRMALRGRLHPDTILRGPTTRQFWSFVRSTPGVAHLVGLCHACGGPADPNQSRCDACDSSFLVSNDRQHLGLAPQQLLPGDAGADAIAEAAFGIQPIQTAPNPTANGAAAPTSLHTQPAPPTPEVPDPPLAMPRRMARRKRSLGPAAVVAGAVLLAAAVISVVLVVSSNSSPSANQANAATTSPATTVGNESGTTPASASSAKPTTPVDQVPSDLPARNESGQAEIPPVTAPTTAPTTGPITGPITGPDASDGVTDQPVPGAEPRPEAVQQPTPATPAVPAPLLRIASMDLEGLRQLRTTWLDDASIPREWLAQLDRRVLQLELAEDAENPG